MRTLVVLGLAAAFVFFDSRPAKADFIVALSARAGDPDPFALKVGDAVTFDVIVSGLAPGDFIDFLGLTLQFDPAHFTVSTVTPGGIIPDLNGFTATPPGVSGFVSALYDDLNLNPPPDFFLPITANGTFFSFSLTAVGAGSGTIQPTSFDTISSVNGSAGGPLEYTIAPAGNMSAVPAPPSALLGGVGVVFVFLLRCAAWRSRWHALPASSR